MAITVQTGSVASNQVAGTSPISASISPPSGLSSGDTWIIIVVDNSGVSTVYTTPAGFTAVSKWSDGTNGLVGVQVFYRPNCSGSETAVTMIETDTSAPNPIKFSWITWRQSGGATLPPGTDIADGGFWSELVVVSGSTTDQTNAAHTPTTDGEAVYLLWAGGDLGTTSAPSATTPSGFSPLGASSDVNGRCFVSVDYAVQTTATLVPVQSTTITFPGTNTFGGAILGAIISFQPPGLSQGAVYTATTRITSWSSAQTVLQLQAPASGAIELLRLRVSVEDQSSNGPFGVQIATTTGAVSWTAATSVTTAPVGARAGVASGTAVSAWGTSPTDGTGKIPILEQGVNTANGYVYLPIPGETLVVAANSYLAVKLLGTLPSATWAITAVWREID